MSETGEYLEISRRARELDSQVIRLTDQLREAQKPLNETKAELAEMRGKWSVAVASLEEYQRKGAEAIHQLSTQLTSERNTNVETIRLLKETAVKDRADPGRPFRAPGFICALRHPGDGHARAGPPDL